MGPGNKVSTKLSNGQSQNLTDLALALGLGGGKDEVYIDGIEVTAKQLAVSAELAELSAIQVIQLLHDNTIHLENKPYLGVTRGGAGLVL